MPGKAFAYRTPVTDVVGLMLERLTGVPLERLLVERIWRPAGAGPATWVRDTGGRVIASAGLSCTLRDLARVGRWLATATDASIAAARASIAAGGDRALFAAGNQPTRPGFSYRSFWWVDHEAGAMNALGVFGQRLHVVPEDDLVIARFGSHPVASNAVTDLVNAHLHAAIRAASVGAL
ncbi:MAG: serine hydrolase [Janthinobacterium lividum]